MSNASSSSDRDKLYKNWIKGGLGLKYVKNGLTKYVVDTVNTQHTDILKTLSRVKCTSCNLETLQPAHTCIINTKREPKRCPLGMKRCPCLRKNQIPCPNNFCGAFHDEIVKFHRYRDPKWSNTDIRKWSSEPWELAKCFINISGYADKTTAEETDCAGILSIICTNEFEFPPTLETLASQVKNTRNNIMHSPTLEVSSTDVEQYLTDMKDLLQGVASISPGFPEVTSAIEDIKMLNKTVFITPKDEEEMRFYALKEFQSEKDRIIKELQKKEQEILSDLKTQSSDEITKEMEAAKANIKSEREQSIKAIDTEMIPTKEKMDKSKQNYVKEIESTAREALTEIRASTKESLDSSTQQTRQTTNSLAELHGKHKDVEMKLEGLEQALVTEQTNVKELHERTDVIEEKQKLMEASISELKSKGTDSVDEISTMKEELKNLDQKMDGLVSLADKAVLTGIHQIMVFLYRVLKPNEDLANGIVADDPNATYTVLQHVANGTWKTQFISTCKTSDAVKDFAIKGKKYAAEHGTTGQRKVVSIDVVKLIQLIPDCIFIDLTHPGVLNEHIPNLPDESNKFSRNCAKKFTEVLIQMPVLRQPHAQDDFGDWMLQQLGIPCRIPPECIQYIGNV